MQEKERQFEQLFHSEYGRMYRAAHILLGDEDEAKDAVQDVFAHLWDGRVVLREESQRTFLLTCVRNRCLNIIAQRQRHREAEIQLALADMPDDLGPWLGKTDDELTSMIQRYIDEQLTPQTGRVIRMHYDDEQSYKEISNTLGISLSAVNKHIVQGLRKLRQNFKVGS
ncbi:MAG: sigma-70 family RNA polymerase sigma factor [Prevotella sp.]|nr:sigma-70 family RNA polymerase sigma factor [Prevotella sp.]